MPPPKTLLLLRSQGLTQSEDADSKPRAQSGRPGDSPVLAIGARRPTEDGANVTLRAGRPLLWKPASPPETHPGGESGRDAGRKHLKHSPPPPRSSASFCPGWAPPPCFPSAPLPALSAVSLCAIGSRPCPRWSAPPRTPETRAPPGGPPTARPCLYSAPPTSAAVANTLAPSRGLASNSARVPFLLAPVRFLGSESNGKAWGGIPCFPREKAELAVGAQPRVGVVSEVRLCPGCSWSRLGVVKSGSEVS